MALCMKGLELDLIEYNILYLNEYDLVDNISEKATTQENNCIFIQIMFHVAVLNVVKIEDLMDTS